MQRFPFMQNIRWIFKDPILLLCKASFLFHPSVAENKFHPQGVQLKIVQCIREKLKADLRL
jgi:hypothetical protein